MFRFPWSNFHELNLDWILEVVKEAKEIFVNGRSDIDNAVETANEALEVAEQAASAVIADGSITIPKLNNEVLKTTAYVIVGNRADDPVPADAYVYLRKSEVAGLSDGIYIAATNLPAGAIVTPAEFQQPSELHDAGVLNVLKNILNQLESKVGKILPVITGSTNNSGYPINIGDYFEANGSLYKANASIPINGAWSSSATAQTNTAVNDLKAAIGFGIFDSGSDSNGTYIRFGNGIQIDFGSFELTAVANNYTEYTLNFPYYTSRGFSAPVAPVCGIQIWADPRLYSVLARGTGQGQVTIRVGSNASTDTNVTVWWFAIGQWA